MMIDFSRRLQHVPIKTKMYLKLYNIFYIVEVRFLLHIFENFVSSEENLGNKLEN